MKKLRNKENTIKERGMKESMKKSMKHVGKMRTVSLLLSLMLIAMMAAPAVSIAAQPTVNLGTASSYAVLAGSAITNTGTTVISGSAGGNVGMHPGTAFTGQSTVTMSGTLHLADAAALLAKNDLLSAYNDIGTKAPVITIPSELGGSTLTPGIYDSADGTFSITGTLTLNAGGDPDGVFIFKTASTLITASGSNVNFINDAQPSKTYWRVGSSATLGINSDFAGHLIAFTSITATTGAAVQGQLLALNGAVTLDASTIVNNVYVPVQPLISITKTPSPLALPSGQGTVTYTFRVTNPGTAALSSVSVTDNKVSPVTYVSGDTNSDSLLQSTETWIYTGSELLTVTTTNTATATGSANGLTATSTAVATVIVTPPVIIPVVPPLINITKTPSPLALTSGQGTVTYTFRVTNPGTAALSSVSVTDDKVSPVTYVSGDTNSDNLLQSTETWTYTGSELLTVTTTNTATATGSANGMTATDTAFATVIVTPAVVIVPPVIVPPALVLPVINVVKIPSPMALTAGPGLVKYTYRVTNPGTVELNNVAISDDKISSLTYVSGDVNADNLLQSTETWIYTGSAYLSVTTTNKATVVGYANGMWETDVAFATVVVTPAAVIPVVPPQINVIKTAAPLALTLGQGPVTYTYKVTNPGTVALSSVSVTDDKVSNVKYISGDANVDNLLQSGETWTYTGSATLTDTTTNTATAKGSANGMIAVDLAFTTVVVTPVSVVPVVPPLINVVKTASPTALLSGEGRVLYTYKVTNPGTVALSSVSVTDDKAGTLYYYAGDINDDRLLQPTETWTYNGVMDLTATTTNTATAKGSANGMVATDVAFATVVVTSAAVETVYPPLINVVKTAVSSVLASGQKSVAYTYKVTNPGTAALSNVSVTDDKVAVVAYVSGDINNDSRLQSDEIWTYTGSAVLAVTTTNTATAMGSANGMTAVDIAVATVAVTQTATGGQIPNTATPWYNILLAGSVLTLIGAAGMKKGWIKSSSN